MDRAKIEINKGDIERWTLPPNGNNVIVEIIERTKDKTTKAGIQVGFNEDVVYAEGEGSHEADVAEVWGVVAGVPDKLYFNKKDINSMPWDTDIQIKVGDTVWFSYLESVNCQVLTTGDRMFYVIPYSKLYVAMRGEEIIPLNGYCLCEPIVQKVDSPLAEGMDTGYVKDRVIVRYLAKPNKAYFSGDSRTYHTDKIDVKEGDEVLIKQNYPLFKLERLGAIATFSDSVYFVVQRRYMEMVLNN